MTKTSAAVRHAAHDAWIQAKGDKSRAIRLFSQHPEAASISRPGRFIQRWGAEFAKRRHYQDAHRPGQPSRIQQSDLERAAKIVKQGYPFNNVTRAFTSFPHALKHSAELQTILKRSNVSQKHFIRRLTQNDDTLFFGKQPLKAAFNLKQKRDRMSACKKHLRQSSHWRQQVFWVDAKKMHVQATPAKAWLDKSQPVTTIPDSRTDGRVTLHFYAAVNAKGGPVAMKYVTGTTDLQSAIQYEVCAHCTA